MKLRTGVLIALTILCNSVGNVLLGIGMKRVGDVRAWAVESVAALAWRMLTTSTIWIGAGTLLLFLIFYMLLLSWADYSYVQPATAAGYAIVPLLGHAIAEEPLSPVRWGGIVLICFGVALVGQTPMRTTAVG